MRPLRTSGNRLLHIQTVGLAEPYRVFFFFLQTVQTEVSRCLGQCPELKTMAPSRQAISWLSALIRPSDPPHAIAYRIEPRNPRKRSKRLTIYKTFIHGLPEHTCTLQYSVSSIAQWSIWYSETTVMRTSRDQSRLNREGIGIQKQVQNPATKRLTVQ